MVSIKDKFEDQNDPEAKKRELRRLSKVQIDRYLNHLNTELEWLIGATPTGDERNTLCEMNIWLGEMVSNFNTIK